jgi:ATP-dependent RNA helicase DeaD
VENDQDSTGISRGLNQLHVVPEDWQAAIGAIQPLIDRVEPNTPALQLLVVTSDAEAAAGIASLITSVSSGGVRTLAATEARRAGRILRTTQAQAVVAPPHVLLELVQSTVLKLDSIKTVVLAWVDELDETAIAALETVMSEVPKETARVVLASTVSPAVEVLIERYARRARRVVPGAAEPLAPVSLSYVTVHETGRAAALRRLLDALDPESAFVVARAAESRALVEAQLRSLGYGGEAATVRTGESPDAAAKLIVLFDMPGDDDELRSLVTQRPAARVVALVSPRQLSTLRRLAGGTVTPLALPEAAARAQTREDAMREELRAMLAAGQFSRELLALEPLLAEYDGSEVAAAALRLLESERGKPRVGSIATAQPTMTRLYLNVGSMDSVRPGDLVGAITNEAGISKAELGKVDVRERHSTVEVATPVANAVVAKLTGVSIRNRRVLARVDEGPERSARPRPDDVRLGSRDRGAGGRDRGGPPRDRGGRPPRDRKREDRPRRERPE